MELGILTAQLAYINQRMGEEEEAMKAYAQLFSFKAELDPAVAGPNPNPNPIPNPNPKPKPNPKPDPSPIPTPSPSPGQVAAVAGNNMVALRGTRDLFDSWKKVNPNPNPNPNPDPNPNLNPDLNPNPNPTLFQVPRQHRERGAAQEAHQAAAVRQQAHSARRLPRAARACHPARASRCLLPGSARTHGSGPGLLRPPVGAATVPTTGAALRPSARAKVAEVAPCVF